jgi:Family of unknown function (DUF6152)
MNAHRWMLAAGLAVGAVVLMKTVPALAHHSSAPFYDATKKVEAQGSVTRFLFKNPHSFLYFQASDEKGQSVEWQIELGPAASLTRTGWTPETLKAGTIIKASGQPSRAEGSHGMCCAKITRADGSPIVAGGRVTEEQQPPR